MKVSPALVTVAEISMFGGGDTRNRFVAEHPRRDLTNWLTWLVLSKQS